MARILPENIDTSMLTREQRLALQQRGVFQRSGNTINPQTGQPEWTAGGFRNPMRIAGTVPQSAGEVGPNYEERLAAMDANRREDFFGGFPQGADNQVVGKEYNRILAERMADQTMNRQQQAQQGRALVNPLPSRLSARDRQQYIDQHPLTETAPAPTPAEMRSHLESIGQPVPADVLAATGGPSEAQAPAFVGQLRSSATELAGMSTKQEYDDLIQRLSAGSAPETVAALKEAAPKYLTQLNPRLGVQVSDQKLVEAKNEDVLAGWYRTQVEPAKDVSNADLSRKVMETPELKARFGLEVGEIAGAGGMALPLNPEIRDVLSLKISKDQENVSFTDPKTGAATTVGAAINKAQQAIVASSGMSREARGAVRAQAIVDANAALDSVKTKLNDTKRMIDSGAMQSVAGIVQQDGESKKVRDMAFQEVKARIGEGNIVQSYAPMIQGLKIDVDALLPRTGIVDAKRIEKEGEADLIKYYPGNGITEMTGQVIVDLQATINKDKSMSPAQMKVAIENSIARVLKSNSKRIDVFSEENGKQVVTELANSVNQRLGDQWKETSARADNELQVNKILPMVSSFVDDSVVINKWTPDKAEFEFASTANLLSDGSQVSKDFIQQLDINGNKIIDRPEEYAAAWMVKKYGAGIIGIAKQLADGSFKNAGNREQTQQLFDTFSSLVGQISGGMAESAIKTGKKVAEEWRTIPDSIASVLKTSALDVTQLPAESRNQKFISEGTPQVNLRNPTANLLERSGNKYWYATESMKVLADSLDDEGLAAFNNTIGKRDGFIGWNNDMNTRRGIVSAMSGRTQDLTEGKDSLYSREWAAEKSVADIANETAADKVRQGGKDVKTTKFVYPKGLEDVYANDPKLKALRDLGALRRASREDTSGKLIDLADVMATEQYRAMESAVIDAGVGEIRRNLALKSSPEIIEKIRLASEGDPTAEAGTSMFGKVKTSAKLNARIRRMVYNDEFTSAQLIELKDQYELQSKTASKSKGDRARQKLIFGGFVQSKTLDGYERSANEIIATINDKLGVSPFEERIARSFNPEGFSPTDAELKEARSKALVPSQAGVR